MLQQPSKQSQRLRRSLDVAAILVLTSLSILIAAGRGLSFDQAIAQWLEAQGQGRPWLDNIMFGVTHFGDTLTIILNTVIFSILLTRLTRQRRPAFTLMLTLGIAWTFNNLLKFLFARARPQLSSLIVDPTSYSYPSGHAMISAAVYGCTALLLSEVFPQRKWLFRMTAVTLVLLIGISRVYLDAHWPTDVIAGFAAGWVTISIVRSWLPRQPAPR